MKIKLLILIVVLLIPISKLFFLKEITDCRCVPLSYPKKGERINLDSALIIDTCRIYSSANCDSVYWNNIESKYHDDALSRVWVKKYWDIHFEVDAIQIDSIVSDTILYVTYTDFDSINYPNILEGFKQLEIKYVTFHLRKVTPQDATGFFGRHFRVTFDNYVKINDIAWDLYYIDSLDYSFVG